VKLECGGTRHAQLHYEFELYQYVNGQQRRPVSKDGLPTPPVRWKDHAVSIPHPNTFFQSLLSPCERL